MLVKCLVTMHIPKSKCHTLNYSVPSYLISILSKTYRVRNSLGYFIGYFLLFCYVVHQIMNFVNIPVKIKGDNLRIYVFDMDEPLLLEIQLSRHARWEDGIPLISLTPPHLCSCHKTVTEFSTSYVVFIFCVQ